MMPLTATKSLALEVVALPVAPVIAETAALTAAVGLPFVYDSDGLASATGTPPIYWSVASGPAEFDIDSYTGEVSWTPFAPGLTPIVITAQNGGGTDTYSFSVDVASSPVPPTILATAASRAIVGLPYRYDDDNRAQAAGTSPITWSVVSAPADHPADREPERDARARLPLRHR